MDIIVIICLILGIACIGISFLMKEKTGIDSQEKEKIAEEIRTKALSAESLSKVMTKVEKEFEGKLLGIAEDKLDGITDSMSEIANKKMLAINEMSGQLIEKIEQNHKEVIFLYDMLNEKSDNLKDFSAKIDGLLKELENEEKRIKALGHDLDDKLVKVKEVRQTVITKPVRQPSQAVESRGQLTAVKEEKKAAAPEIERKKAPVPSQAQALLKMQKEKEKAISQTKQEETLENKVIITPPEQEIQPEFVKEEPEVLEPETKPEEISTNDKILKLKEEGKSVIEISKTLGIGQGEVQLILGLYGK